jgi:heme A synthase
MSRIILELLPLALPFALYGLYIWQLRRRGQRGPLITPWFWLAAIGMTLVIATMIVGGLIFGEQPGHYVPATYQNGKIVPGRVQ